MMKALCTSLRPLAAITFLLASGCIGSDDSDTSARNICPQEAQPALSGLIDPDDDCPSDQCGDGVCSGNESCSSCATDCGVCWDPDTLNIPGVPQLVTREEVDALAQSLGVTPLMAGSPNIVDFVNQPGIAFSYPVGATSVQDFFNKLFQSGIWASTTNVVVTPLAPDANGCQLKRVDATYNPEEFVSFDAGAGLLFPSAIAQGQFVNLGVGSFTPLHVPYTQRQPARLTSDIWVQGTAPTATATDVYAEIGTMIRTAHAQGTISPSKVVFDKQSASSLEEYAAKVKLDTKLFGGSLSASLSVSGSKQSNTVFVRFTQSLFNVQQDLRGYPPPGAQFNNTLTVADLENLGATGELAYNNLPTYVRTVTYGRMLLFSVTSTSSKEELEAAVNAVYGKTSVAASASQKKVISDSTLKVFGYGGPAEPQISAIQAGDYLSYFTLQNVPLTSLKPLGYEVRRFDDQLATMQRTTSYTERTCPGVHKISVRLSEVYKKATLSVQKTGSLNYEKIIDTEDFSEVQINSFLVGGDDQIKIGVTVDKPWFLGASQSEMRLQIFVDGVEVANRYYECRTCHSKGDVWVYRVNQFTGEVTKLQGP
ncbi:MAG: thiol-activated cytolysin family protein [Deltaproteobacteria bacterium]|nr:thiol-activated cytolysin family protein [Deltaproteobacteria bacterium]